jgi:hypothetical protein
VRAITLRLGRHTTRRLVSVAAVSIGLIVSGGPASATEPSAAEFTAMGSTSAPSYVLPPGCHWYSYSYRVSPPEPEWSLEVFITDAAGVAQASDVMISGADATSGTKRFQLCESNTAAPGLFTIRGRLTYHHYASMPFVDQERDYAGWIAASQFRVTKQHAGRPSARCVRARHRADRLHTAKARRAAHRACHRR